MHIFAAGSVVVPAYLVILSKGYEVTGGKHGSLVATKGEHSFVADDPIVLLGLIAVGEARGEDWRAEDHEIEDFLAKYEP